MQENGNKNFKLIKKTSGMKWLPDGSQILQKSYPLSMDFQSSVILEQGFVDCHYLVVCHLARVAGRAYVFDSLL